MKIIETSWANNHRMIHIGRGHSTTPIESAKDSAEAYRKSAEELRRLADECEAKADENT